MISRTNLSYATVLGLATLLALACQRVASETSVDGDVGREAPAGERAPGMSDRELRAAYARPSGEWPAPTLDSGVEHRELAILKREGLAAPPETYADIAVADQRALRELGKRLFFDPRLSASNQISCASCHDPDLAWGDGRRRSFGHDRTRGRRNAPSLLNAGHWTVLFWDGRAGNLEDQAFGPLQDHLEMRESLSTIGAELGAVEGYPALFGRALGDEEIDARRVAVALAAFERTLRSRTSRLDHFIAGEYDALGDDELRGLHLFRTKARCLNCHNGALLSDQEFHNNGAHLIGRNGEDLGRYLVTGDWADAGAFRTPMLRDVAFTGPYFHHGNIAELREVIQLYNAGMPQVIPRGVRDTLSRVPAHDLLLRPLELTEGEIDDLLAFLEAVSTRPRAMRVPEAL